MSKPAAIFASMAVWIALGGSLDSTGSQSSPTTQLFDRYAQGEYDAAARSAASDANPGRFWRQFQADASVWVLAAGSDDVERRRLILATFVLEAVRASRDTEMLLPVPERQQKWRPRRA